eukprot:gene4315-31899_t
MKAAFLIIFVAGAAHAQKADASAEDVGHDYESEENDAYSYDYDYDYDYEEEEEKDVAGEEDVTVDHSADESSPAPQVAGLSSPMSAGVMSSSPAVSSATSAALVFAAAGVVVGLAAQVRYRNKDYTAISSTTGSMGLTMYPLHSVATTEPAEPRSSIL